jgi:hypothetical protein
MRALVPPSMVAIGQAEDTTQARGIVDGLVREFKLTSAVSDSQ